MIQSGLRRAIAASAAQAGGGDWIINPLPAGRPSGIELQRLQDGRIQDNLSVLKGWKAFYLAALRAVERLPAK